MLLRVRRREGRGVGETRQMVGKAITLRNDSNEPEKLREKRDTPSINIYMAAMTARRNSERRW